ncbi:MAG: hypothetical protein AB8E82_13735 [Aureispira sp.]
MIETFKQLSDELNGKLQVQKSRWYDGYAYFPLNCYELNFEYQTAQVNIFYENRDSEFSKPSALDSGLFGSRHICEITCKLSTENTCLPPFRLEGRGYFKRIFYPFDKPNYALKCKEKHFSKWLDKNKELYSIYKIVENSSEFEPLMIGKIIRGKSNPRYELRIAYNTQRSKKEIIEMLVTFLKAILRYKKG